MHAQYSLFQQGFNLLDEIDPYMKKLAAEVSITITLTGLIQSHGQPTALLLRQALNPGS